MRRTRSSAHLGAATPFVVAALASFLVPMASAPIAAQDAITTADMTAILPREIGPAVSGGRIHDVESLASNPSLVYVASASGGLWRSVNRGHTWESLTDDLPVSTFGDVALAPSNPSIVYAGTGEQNNRNSTSWGGGVFKSMDGGDTWTFLGLEETRHIGEVQVHPRNPDIVFVAALGNLWAPSQDRGVYRSTDGGATWDKVLYVNEYTGAVDLVIDPENPRNVYAAMYQRERKAWGFNGGGPGSGLYKSNDGGATWREITAGIPTEDKGRIGLAISASNPAVLMALVETASRETTGTYRSEDHGETWTRMSGNNGRPMYYSHIYIDPTDDMRVYTMATNAAVSTDGGRSFTPVADDPVYDVGVHLDHHTMWIDPLDPSHFWMAGDGGLHETYDRGLTFRKVNNFAISQAHAIGVDHRDPYRVYIGLQDNHSFATANEGRRWIGIVNDDWQQVGFSDGTYWQPNPFDSTQAYGSSWNGNYFRTDTRTGDILPITPMEAEGESFRWDFVSPMLQSRHDPDVVYVASQYMHRSEDRGESWTHSADLSRGVDTDTMSIQGIPHPDVNISRDDGVVGFGVGVTMSESPIDPNVVWVGIDDGNVQVSRDGGRTFTEVSRNVPGLPDGSYPSRIAASHASAGTAWVSFDRHRDGDFAPYLYRTTDFGMTWTALHGGLPSGSINGIAEHPENPDVVFIGTEHALWVSTTRGADWAKVPNLPTTLYDDLIIHPRDLDLVIGTHGRGVWILDDVRMFAEWSDADPNAHVFQVPDRAIFQYWKDTSYRAHAEYAGTNPPDGVEITYRLGDGAGPATLRIENARGETVRTLEVPSGAGVHRVNWDLKWGFQDGEVWERWEHPELERRTGGGGAHWVAPGTFTAVLEARGTTSRSTFSVLPDPSMDLTQADYDFRESFFNRVQALVASVQARMEGAPASEQGELRNLMRSLQRAAGSLGGGGAQQGSLYPPTRQMIEAVDAIEAALGGR